MAPLFGKRRRSASEELAILRTRSARLEAICSLSRAVADAPDLSALCRVLGESVRAVLGVDAAYVALYDRGTGLLSFPFFVYRDRETRVDPIEPSGGPTALVLNTGETRVMDAREIADCGGRSILDDGSFAKSYLGVPIKSSAETVGVLSVQSYESEGRFGPEEREFLEELASYVSFFVSTAAAKERGRRRITRLSILSEIGNALSQTRGEEPLFQAVHEQIGRLFDAKFFYIATYTEGSSFWNACYTYRNGERLPPERYPVMRGFCGYILRTRAPLLFASEQEMESFVTERRVDAIGDTPRSWIGVPMAAGDKIYGVMAIEDYDRRKAYDREDLELFSLIGTQTAIAIQNSRLYDEVRRTANEMAALVDIGREVTSSLDLATVLERIARKARELLTRDSAAVYLVDPGTAYLEIAASAGSRAADPGRARIASGEGIIGDVVKLGITRVVNAPDVDHAAPRGWTSQAADGKLMAIPIADRGSAIGALAVWRGGDEADFDDGALSLGAGLARQAAVAISNARAFERAQKSQAEAEEANRLKSRFLANMSHELRTPLNAIINFAYLLRIGAEGQVSDGQADLLGRVEESGHHLLGLINDVLDLAKIESGKMELSFEDCDPVELAKSALSTAGALVKGKDVRIVDALPETLPEIRADRTRFRQVLLNLVSNAAKFTERGSITVSARVADDGAFVEFSVVDTGIGIAPEHLAKVFVEFVQVEGELTRKHGGTGLGLPISRKFVEMHGGSMVAESVPGEGSAFRFTIPAAKPATARSDGHRRHCAARPEPPKVLFVDDDAITREAITRLLARGRYHVVTLDDSRRASEEARRAKPDAILLDIMMPHASGWDVIRALKDDPETRDIPVVMCSILQERDMALSLSASAFVAKPVSGEELQRTVTRLAPPGGTILAIDDDADSLEIVERILGQLEYRVDTAANGMKGLESIRSSPPDAIVLDLMMPGMNGFDLLAELERDPATRDIPKIVVTAKDLDPDEREILMKHVTALLEKGSFRPCELDEVIKSSLRAANRAGGKTSAP